MYLRDTLVIETPENIFLEFELAGLGSRFLAYVIDTFIEGILLFVLTYIVGILATVGGLAFKNVTYDNSWTTVVLVFGVFIIYECYFIFFETYWRGQTPGKRVMSLRVIKEGGYPIRFFDAVVRNILRVVDMMPPLWFFPSYGLGSFVLMNNRQSKRLGDFVAGTLVIKEKSASGFENMTSVRVTPEYIQNIRMTGVSRITDNEYFLVREFFYRKNLFTPERRQWVAHRIATVIRKKLKVDERAYQNDIRFLDDLMFLMESRRN